MSVLVIQPSAMKDRDAFGFLDDLEWYISPHRFTSLSADAGVTAPVEASSATAVGGVVTMSTGATDNNEVAFGTTNAFFLLADNKPFFGEALVQYAEANTDDANIAVGFADTINAADFLLDNGAGPRSSWSGAVIYKVDSGSVNNWRVRSSNGTTFTDNVTQIAAGGSAFVRLRVEVADYTATLAQVTYFIDGLQLRDNVTNLPIVHTVAYASAAAMKFGVYLKAGGANSETLLTDYVAPFQAR